MNLYIVRVSESKTAVGILAAKSLNDLRDLVDEVFDPNDCDYRPVTHGGGVFFDDVHVLPRALTEDGGENDTEMETFVGLESHINNMTEDLWDALHADNDKGWKPLRPSRSTWLPGVGACPDAEMQAATPLGLRLRATAAMLNIDAPGAKPTKDQVLAAMGRMVPA